MAKVILPTALDEYIPERRRLRTRLTEDAAKPIDAHAGRVADRGPDRPEIGGRSDCELLGRHRRDDLGQSPVVLRPAVVEAPDRHQLKASSTVGSRSSISQAWSIT